MNGEHDNALLTTQGLVMSYGQFRAIDGVDLRVRDGGVHAIIGPNGAGKTTLFHCLTGERRPTAGQVVFNGVNVTRHRTHTRVGTGMARSFQITSLFQNLSVRENLRLAAQGQDGPRALAFWHSRYRRQQHVASAEALLERLDLTRQAGTDVGYLSHGQQRILEVGMALAGKPRLLLLDEPTSGMGVDDIPGMTRLIGELGSEHTVLLIEHNMSIVMSISQTVTVMHQGGVLVEGDPRTVSTDERVRTAYLGESA